jgi:hypothetical protein
MLRVRIMSSDKGLTVETAISVNSVEEEYKYLRQQRCPQCGGLGYKLIRQSLLDTEVGPCDRLETECVTCSGTQNFFFNVTAVFEDYKHMFDPQDD